MADPEGSPDSLSRLKADAQGPVPFHASSRLIRFRTAIGLNAQAPVDELHDLHANSDLWWPRVRLALREPLAEFWGTFILIAFGNGSVAQVLLSSNTPGPSGNGFGEYQSISWGWGVGIMMGLYVAGDSGAFLNPAVCLAFSVYRGFPFRRVPVYMLAQFLGAFVASGVVYANYINAINDFAGYGVRTIPPAPTATGGIFCTYPQAFLSKTSQVFSEFITSAILQFCVFALKDSSNSGGFNATANWFPLALFFLLFGLGACFGYETGYAINFARDVGPRAMSTILGYKGAWSAGDNYFLVPMFVPFAGCLFGGFLYDVFVYTGPDSPINTPWMGLPYLLRPDKALQARWKARKAAETQRVAKEQAPDGEMSQPAKV